MSHHAVRGSIGAGHVSVQLTPLRLPRWFYFSALLSCLAELREGRELGCAKPWRSGAATSLVGPQPPPLPRSFEVVSRSSLFCSLFHLPPFTSSTFSHPRRRPCTASPAHPPSSLPTSMGPSPTTSSRPTLPPHAPSPLVPTACSLPLLVSPVVASKPPSAHGGCARRTWLPTSLTTRLPTAARPFVVPTGSSSAA